MANWLCEKREKLVLSQEKVAGLAKIPRTTYASIEQGRRNPSVKNAMRIAEGLEFDWTIFFNQELRDLTTGKKNRR